MPANVPEERCKTVESARQVWIHKLIDLSRRNSLLYFRPLKTGTLDFSEAPSESLRELLAGETVAASKLAPSLESDALKKSISARLEEDKDLAAALVQERVETPAPTSGSISRKHQQTQPS